MVWFESPARIESWAIQGNRQDKTEDIKMVYMSTESYPFNQDQYTASHWLRPTHLHYTKQPTVDSMIPSSSLSGPKKLNFNPKKNNNSKQTNKLYTSNKLQLLSLVECWRSALSANNLLLSMTTDGLPQWHVERLNVYVLIWSMTPAQNLPKNFLAPRALRSWMVWGHRCKTLLREKLSRFSTMTTRAPSKAVSTATRRPTGPAPTTSTYI